MVVRKTSVFPAPRDTVFERLQKLETLQLIAKPYAVFEPVGIVKSIWAVGSTSAYRFRLFGLIPFGTHTIRIVRFDPERISSREGNEHVPIWNHDISLIPLDDAHTEYLGALVFIGYDGLRRGNGFWLLFGRYLLFFYGYKVFDILVQDQHIVIRKKYYLRFYPETRDCESWNDYSFNKRNQMKRLIAFPFVCALLAWITLRIGG